MGSTSKALAVDLACAEQGSVPRPSSSSRPPSTAACRAHPISSVERSTWRAASVGLPWRAASHTGLLGSGRRLELKV